MYGLNAVTTLGVRIGKDLNEHISEATERLNKAKGWRYWTKSEVSRKALEAFFFGDDEFLAEYRKAMRRKR